MCMSKLLCPNFDKFGSAIYGKETDAQKPPARQREMAVHAWLHAHGFSIGTHTSSKTGGGIP